MQKCFWMGLILLCATKLSAQTSSHISRILLNNDTIKINVVFNIRSAPCTPDGRLSDFHYEITRIRKIKKGYFVRWNFNYFNCENELKFKPNTLVIPPSNKPIIDQSSYFSIKEMAGIVLMSAGTKLSEPKSNVVPVSPKSMEPEYIIGGRVIKEGKSTILSLQHGYLAQNATWNWYENQSGMRLKWEGPVFEARPPKTTTYFVRAEGPGDTTKFDTVTIHVVDENSTPPTAIDGKSKICVGDQNVPLTVLGGNLADGAKWVWYKNDINSTPFKTGDTIFVSPEQTTRYFVRAENGATHTTYSSFEVKVLKKPTAAISIDGPEKCAMGASVTLYVNGPLLESGEKWLWLRDEIPVGSGPSYVTNPLYATASYAVVAQDSCYRSTAVFKTITVDVPPVVIPFKLFLNVGLVANDAQNISNLKTFEAAFGGGIKNVGFYIRGKFSIDNISSSFETAGGTITNYNIPGYYQYNGRSSAYRVAGTAGLYFGWPFFSVYAGAGYGKRTLFYGIDEYQYNGDTAGNSGWAKNTANSFEGFEEEGGLLLRFGWFNFMGGAGTFNFKYTDYHIGFGVNF